LDVTEKSQAKTLLEEAARMGPISGIFHLAMVLNDKWLSNQVGPPFRPVHWEYFIPRNRVLKPETWERYCASCLSLLRNNDA
jgi:KR domain